MSESVNYKRPHDYVDERVNLAITELHRSFSCDSAKDALVLCGEPIALPFPHILWSNFLPPLIADQALSWLETVHIWKREESNLHLYDSFNLSDIHIPGAVGSVVSAYFLGHMRRSLEETLQVRLSSVVRVQVHRLLLGYRIGVHTDAQAREVRVVVTLCRSYPVLSGGELILFALPDECQKRRAYPPLHNQAIGFKTGAATPHAVSQVYDGTRFSLIYRFGLTF